MLGHEYAFINARVGGMKAHLLNSMEMKSLIESRNFDDALALLKNTAYGKELSKLPSPSLVEIENVFSKSVVRDCEKLVISVSGASKKFLTLYTKKFEIDAIKLLLIMKGRGEEIKKYPWILQRIMSMPVAEKLVEIGTPEEVVEMLRSTKYYPALQKAVSEYNEQGDVYPFIAALDIYHYGALNKVIKKEMSAKDRKFAERLIGLEIDAKNLLTVLRIRGIDEEQATNWLIPVRYKLTDSDLRAAFNVRALTELTQIIERYSGIISTGIRGQEKTQSLFALEQEFRKYILKANNRLFSGDRFHMGVPLAYLNLKENEVRNLTAILHGKEKGMDTSKIEETTILLNS